MTQQTKGLGINWSWISRFGSVRFGFWVDWSALICDLSHITVVMVGSVLHVLNTTVWQSYRVGA